MRRARRALATVLLAGLVAGAVGAGTWAAFSSTTAVSGNEYAAGTVHLSDNDAGAAALSLSNARPGDATSACILVTYGGSLPAEVRLFGDVTGDLAPYLTLTVTRGTDSAPSFPSCTGFTADATDFLGLGAGVVFSGALSDFPATWAGGIVDPLTASPESWTTGESHAYRLRVELGSNSAAEGLSATATLRWEARNS